MMFQPNPAFPRVADNFYMVDPDGYHIRNIRPGEVLPERFEGGFTLFRLVFVLDPDDDPANWPRSFWPTPGDYPFHFVAADAFGGRVERAGSRSAILALPSSRRFRLIREPKGFRSWTEVDRDTPADVARFNSVTDPDPLTSAVMALRNLVPVN
jgi:hypothetical protein